MRRVRIANRVGPFRPAPIPVFPIRPYPVPVPVPVPIPVIAVQQGPVRRAPIRRAVPNQQVNHPAPAHHQSPVVTRNHLLGPQNLPVLHAPFFPKEYEYYGGEEEEYGEGSAYPTVVIQDQHVTITPHLRQRMSTSRLSHAYSQQRLTHRIKPRHPPYVYYNR